MSLSNTQYNSIMRAYENRQMNSRHALDEKRRYVYEQIEEFQELDASVASISVLQGRKLLEGDESALPLLKEELARISSEKIRLLKEHGLPKDYLEPSYICPDCKDTGYIDNAKCHCFKQAEISLRYEHSNISYVLNEAGFSGLSYDYYTGVDLQRFESAVKSCQKFIQKFNTDYQNLFFYGTVGTGKSFLSGCIAKELLETGHSVLYFSCCGLFETLSQISFDFKSKEQLHDMYDDLYSCDLLITDDLGTEMTNNFVTSQLFSILNERHLRKKSSIISTNLSLEELRNRYSDRIFSRITSHYVLCKFSGPDIRILKKINNI